MAVGTETGNIVIYQATMAGQFQECLVLGHECVIPLHASRIDTNFHPP